MKRRLTLTSEHLTELTDAEMSALAGAAQEIQTLLCFTGVYPTINTPCPTQDCIYIERTPLCPTEL